MSENRTKTQAFEVEGEGWWLVGGGGGGGSVKWVGGAWRGGGGWRRVRRVEEGVGEEGGGRVGGHRRSIPCIYTMYTKNNYPSLKNSTVWSCPCAYTFTTNTTFCP